jgi:hypothetical protein
MTLIAGILIGVCGSAAFPGPAAVIRAMVAYCWNAAVEAWQSFRAPKG